MFLQAAFDGAEYEEDLTMDAAFRFWHKGTEEKCCITRYVKTFENMTLRLCGNVNAITGITYLSCVKKYFVALTSNHWKPQKVPLFTKK